MVLIFYSLSYSLPGSGLRELSAKWENRSMCKNVSCHSLAVKRSVHLFESRPVVMQCVFHDVSHLQSCGSECHYVRQSAARPGLSVEVSLVI